MGSPEKYFLVGPHANKLNSTFLHFLTYKMHLLIMSNCTHKKIKLFAQCLSYSKLFTNISYYNIKGKVNRH